MIKIHNKETIHLLSDTLKDMLCRQYNWIQMTIDKDNYTHVKSFTEDAVYICCSQIEIMGRCSSKYAKTFITNLDLIKDLVDNQPTYEIEKTYGTMIGDTLVTDTCIEILKTYDVNRLRDRQSGFKYERNFISDKCKII